MRKKILILDDNTDILEILILLLTEFGYEAKPLSSGERVFEEIKEFQPDLLLMDVMLANMNGLKICKEIKLNNQTASLPVILMSGSHDLANILDQPGSPEDFLEKPFQNNLLVDKVESARQAALALQADSTERLLFQKALAALSPREREVLDQLLQGHYNKNIADHLGITPRTVEFHRANIFEKLQVNSAVELAHLMGRLAFY